MTVPAVKVDNLADTVGAGDTFMSALIYQLQGQQAAPSDTELARWSLRRQGIGDKLLANRM